MTREAILEEYYARQDARFRNERALFPVKTIQVSAIPARMTVHEIADMKNYNIYLKVKRS
jgi:hypothetical protein